MDNCEEGGDETPVATADLGEHLRTWRMFVRKIGVVLALTALALVLLLACRTHG